MPITGTLVADFASFYDAVQKADVSLDGLEKTGDSVTRSLTRMVEQFSGGKLIQQANLAVEAVNRIGGATALTETEQAKLNALVTEAIDKYSALGQSAPAAMVAAQQATQAAADALSKVKDVGEESTSGFSKFLGDIGTEIASTAAGMVSAQAAIGAVEGAFHALTEFIGSSVEAYAKMETASTRMTVALRAQGTATPENIEAMRKLADQYENTTAYSRELITTSESLFTQLGNVGPGEMDKAMQAATDLASGLGIDLETAVRSVSKAAEGNVTGLKRYGVQLDASRAQAEGLDYVVGELEKRFGGQAQAELDTYAGSVKQLSNEWETFKESVGEIIIKDPLVQAALKALHDEARSTADDMKNQYTPTLTDYWIKWSTGSQTLGAVVGWFEAADQAMENLDKEAKGMKLGMEPPKIAKPDASFFAGLKEASDAEIAATKAAWKAEEEAQKKAAEAAKQYAAQIQKMADQLSGAALAKQAKDLDAAWQLVLKSGPPTADALQRAGDAAAKLLKEGAPISPELTQLAVTFGNLLPPVKDGIEGLHNFGTEIQHVTIPQTALLQAELDKLVAKMDATTRTGISGLENIGIKVSSGFPEAVKRMEAAEKEEKAALQDLQKGFSDLASAAGGSIGKIIGDLGKMAGSIKDAHKAYGDFQAAMSNPDASGFTKLASGIGAASSIASVAIQGVSLIKSAWDHFFGTAGRQAVQAFEATQGGAANLQKQLNALGATGQAAWQQLAGVKKNDAAGAQAAIQNITTLLDQEQQALAADETKYGLTDALTTSNTAAQTLLDSFGRLVNAGKDTSSIVAGMSGDINTWLGNALDAGVKIPAGMQPILDQLVQMGKLTDDNARKLLGLDTKLDGGTFDDITAAASRYGIQLDALGPKVNQLNIEKQAQQLSSDWKLLTSDGEDTNAVMTAMKGKVQDVVTAALKFGDSVPSSMQGMIDQMIAAGDLTDALGNKLTDDSSINWETPLTDQVDKLVTSIQGLVDALTGGGSSLSGALNKIGNTVVNPKIQPVVDNSQVPSNLAGALTGLSPAQSGAVLAAPASGATTVTVNANLTADGYNLAKVVVPNIPAVVTSKGLNK